MAKKRTRSRRPGRRNVVFDSVRETLRIVAHPLRWAIVKALAKQSATTYELSEALSASYGSVNVSLQVLLKQHLVTRTGARPITYQLSRRVRSERQGRVITICAKKLPMWEIEIASVRKRLRSLSK